MCNKLQRKLFYTLTKRLSVYHDHNRKPPRCMIYLSAVHINHNGGCTVVAKNWYPGTQCRICKGHKLDQSWVNFIAEMLGVRNANASLLSVNLNFWWNWAVLPLSAIAMQTMNIYNRFCKYPLFFIKIQYSTYVLHTEKYCNINR